MVPEGPDRARERAGDRRTLRALRHGGRVQEPHPVVLQDHRVRRPAARRDGGARVVARARPDDAAQLDRALRRSPRDLHRRRERGGAARLHDAARHAVRGDILRPGPRASAHLGADRGHRARAGRRRLRPAHGRPLDRRARDEGEGRRLHRPLRGQPGERRGDPDLGRRLRADGVRHRRDHGGARARRARSPVRGTLRPRDPPGRGAGRRIGVSRRGRLRRAHRRRGARQLGRVHRAHRSGGEAGDHRLARTSAVSARRRSAIACATGCSRGSATGAARSR